MSGASGKLPRAERREQILRTALPIFAETGYAATSLEEIAEAAGVSRVILYRHFAAKPDLYRAVLEHAGERLAQAMGAELTESSVAALMRWASANPQAFRLLFHLAGREPEFREDIDRLRDEMARFVYGHLTEVNEDERWTRWAARLSLAVVVEAIMTWLDVGSPDPDQAARRVDHVVRAVIAAARGA